MKHMILEMGMGGCVGYGCVWGLGGSRCGCSRQWRSEGIWRPGANLNFAPPPHKKFLKNDNKMSSIQLIMCIIISA